MKSHKHFPTQMMENIACIWAALLVFRYSPNKNCNSISIISPHWLKSPLLFTSSFAKDPFSLFDIFRIAFGVSLVVWHNVTTVKDVLSLHFSSRDNPFIAPSACHGTTVLCSLALRGNCQCCSSLWKFPH